MTTNLVETLASTLVTIGLFTSMLAVLVSVV